MSFAAVSFNYRALPQLECKDTREEATAHLLEVANGYLEAGEVPPLLDDWFVAEVTDGIERVDSPRAGTSVRIMEESLRRTA